MRKVLFAGLLVLVLALVGFQTSILLSDPQTVTESAPVPASPGYQNGDQELAYLLVKLELKTRSVVADHLTRSQSPVPGVDQVYQRWLTKNRVLPAAVADKIYAETVPHATGGRAWVKMVVREPRNPHNQGDGLALEMLRELQGGAKAASRSTPDAYYYGEPIVAKKWCLRCHGDPRGEADPNFPQYKKDGWREGDVIGGVIARVASKK